MADGSGSEGPWFGLTAYQPRQVFLPFHKRTHRFGCIVAHRRAGKTVAAVADLALCAAATRKQDARYGFVAPFRNQAKDAAWLYVKRLTSDLPLAAPPNESELRVDLKNGARIRIYGADNYDAMRGPYFDGVVLDEYGDMDPRAWSEVIRPMLSDRQGWAVFMGTPKGRNDFHRQHERSKSDAEWFSVTLKASDTRILPEAELASARRDMSEDQYAQEYECSFEAAVVGAYYGKLMGQLDTDKRIGNLPWEPALPVYTAWDLGIGDPTAIWFAQQIAKEIRLIDYYEAADQGMAHYAKIIKEKPYVYAEHIVPSDAAAKLQDEHGKTRVEILASLGIKVRVLGQNKIDDGIEAVRVLLPKCWFDAGKCAHGIEALRQYRKAWDEKLKVFKDHPLHDWTSHPADAFRYLAIGLKPAAGKAAPSSEPKDWRWT